VRSSGDESSLPLSVQPKRLALLVYLALDDATGFRRRDSAVAYFWPELDTPHARGALRQALHSLRRLIGDEAIVVRGEEEIGVRRDAVRCDAVSFRECTEAGRHDEALTLYRGDFLDGFFASDVAPEFEQWVEDTRLDLRRRAAKSAWSLAYARRTDGDLEAASALAHRASRLESGDENCVARLISFLDEIGDRGGALEAYSELAIRLRREFDADPSPETQALVDRVRRRTIAAPHAPPSEATAVHAPPTSLPAHSKDRPTGSRARRIG